MTEQSRRAQLMRALREAGRPLGVSEAARLLGVHANTVRFHLDSLVADGLVERSTHQHEGPGRPRALYAPRPGMDRGGARDYRLLARILASSVAANGPAAASDGARVAGRAWGRHLVDSPAPFRRTDEAEARTRLTGLLDDLGFAPEPRRAEAAPDAGAAKADAGDDVLRLRHCPFLELAEEFGSVICPLHLGLMQGALEELDAPVTAARLEPFAEPDACLVHLGPRDADPSETSKTRTKQ